MAESVMRAVALRLLPSTKQPIILARRSMLNLFMVTIMLERIGNVKKKIDWNKKLYNQRYHLVLQFLSAFLAIF